MYFTVFLYRNIKQRMQTIGWNDIWDKKGQTQSRSDVRLLTGYEGTNFYPKSYAKEWKSIVQWQKGESVLDVGCGAGFLGEHLPMEGYVGIERVESLASAFIERTNRKVMVQDAEKLPFPDNVFDHVISHSMLQYLPSKDAAYRAIQEMKRVARKTVFLGDLRSEGHDKKQTKHVMEGTFQHILFQRSDFTLPATPILSDFTVSDGLWGGSTRFNALHRTNDKLHTVIIGGGPAGCGILTNFALHGEYDEFLDKGIALIEAGEKIGGGSIKQYSHLMSNSHGCAFFDTFKELHIEAHDTTLNRNTSIPMSELHRLQETIGSWHNDKIKQHPISRVFVNMQVIGVKEQMDGSYCVQYTSTSDNRPINEVITDNVCVCTGGVPYVPSFVNGIDVESVTDYFSGIRMPDPEVKSIAIIGYSHSAFSFAHLWHKRCPDTRITFIRRKTCSSTPPLIYFESKKDAQSVGYQYKEHDVCAETGRVHRFGGMRGDARKFALMPQLYKVKTDMCPEDYERIVVACGFRMRSIPFFNKDNIKLIPEINASGMVVDNQGCLFAGHRIYAFGLGAGLHPNEHTGGELGCTRRADGIWLYQNTVGTIIRKSLTRRLSEWKIIYNRIARKSLDDTPLHHVGGYTMFTRQEWDDQVRQLLTAFGITNIDTESRVFESGVGGGAFLDSLHRLYGTTAVEGCDTAEECIKIACKKLPWGNFWVSDAADLSRVADESKDGCIMFGVTPYMDDERHVERAIQELLRIVKKGGWILVAENNDPLRRKLADSLRKQSHSLVSNHLFLSTNFWKKFPTAEVKNHVDIGLKYPTAPYRYSVLLHK